MRFARTLSTLRVGAIVAGGAVLATVAGLGPTPAVAAPPVPTLVDVRASHVGSVDRVVFEFRDGLPSSRTVSYADRLLADGSGRPVRIAGRAILQVRFELAQAHDATGVTAPGRVAFPLPNVMTAVRSGDFEAVTTYGLGLARRTAFTVATRTSPPRVIVRVSAGFPTTSRRVWFFDEPRYLANTEPFFTSVRRPVPTAAPAAGLLDRIFAGPTASERASGLRLLRSKARGWADLGIGGDVARVRLTGGCSSGGSTVTVAGEIAPTLRALSRVDFVKIYDPAGSTGTPTGRSDSIPACLEP